MSDRISIDHINNTISIQVTTQDLSQMTDMEIMIWLHKFINNIQKTNLQIGIIKDIIEDDS